MLVDEEQVRALSLGYKTCLSHSLDSGCNSSSRLLWSTEPSAQQNQSQSKQIPGWASLLRQESLSSSLNVAHGGPAAACGPTAWAFRWTGACRQGRTVEDTPPSTRRQQGRAGSLPGKDTDFNIVLDAESSFQTKSYAELQCSAGSRSGGRQGGAGNQPAQTPRIPTPPGDPRAPSLSHQSSTRRGSTPHCTSGKLSPIERDVHFSRLHNEYVLRIQQKVNHAFSEPKHLCKRAACTGGKSK